MRNFYELFDPAASQESTPIPEFKLNYLIETSAYEPMEADASSRNTKFYFYRSLHNYFNIKPNAFAKDNIETNAELPISIIKDFALAEHASVVADHVKLYKEKSAALVALDQKIMSAALLGMVAANTPFIPFVGLVSIAAWLAAVYFLGQRADAYNEYQDALVLLVGTCNWALGAKRNQEKDDDTPEELSRNPQIMSMMECLYPVLSRKQVEHLIDDSIEENYSSALDGYNKRFKLPLVGRFFGNSASEAGKAVHHELENIALKQRGAEFFRCVYGLNRGSAKDFLRVFVNAVPDLVSALRNVAQAATRAPQPTEETTLNMGSSA